MITFIVVVVPNLCNTVHHPPHYHHNTFYMEKMMILKHGKDMKNDIIKLSHGWEAEFFYNIHDSDKAQKLVSFLLDELFVYIEDGCELEDRK